MAGASVTMPHKVAIIPHLDDITSEAKAVGACNTIFRRDNQMVGTNTDTIGVREALYQNVADPDTCFHNRPGLVIGGGGAARSAVYALTHFMKCPKVYLVNRDAQEVDSVITWCTKQGYGETLVHVATAAQAESLEGCGAIVSCVPNFPPVTEDERMARNITQVFLDKPYKGALLELCYHPTPWTEIAALAQTGGWQVILGTECVIYQGLEQDRLWTGRELHELPVQSVKDAIETELSRTGH